MNPHASDAVASALDVLRWSVQGSPPERASVEMSYTQTWTVARLWATPSLLTTRSHPGIFRVILCIDGEASFRIGPTHVVLHPQQMIVFDGQSSVTAENQTLWARFEWHLRSIRFQHDPLVRHLAQPIDIHPTFVQLLRATTNVISTSTRFSQSPSHGLTLDALAGFIAAAIVDSLDSSTSMTSVQASLYQEALGIIEERYRDTSFTVRTLIHALAVSESYLHRVFARSNTTPRQEIESRRAAAAQALLDAVSVHDKQTDEGIATQAGFSSVRQMQTALHRARKRAI